MVTESEGTGDEPRWERVLWRPQPFPDNYVPPTFLAALSKNRKQRFKLSYLKVTERCLFFVQQMYFRINTGRWFWVRVLSANTSPSFLSSWLSSLGYSIKHSTRACWLSSLARPSLLDV